MKIDIAESLIYSYLRHVKNCYIAQINWKPSGNWEPDEESLVRAKKEFDRIQRHPAFTEIFKTGFDPTLKQTEIDVLGIGSDNTVYAVNVTFHEFGINFGAKTDTRNRVIKNLLRAHLALNVYFPGRKHVMMFCSPKVSPYTEEVISDYFKILDADFSSEHAWFLYLSNENFRDKVLMETLDCIQDEFDTSELFLRSFKLLTAYAGEGPDDGPSEDEEKQEPAVTQQELIPVAEIPLQKKQESLSETADNPVNGTQNEKAGEEKIAGEINKVQNRVPKWFQHPNQTNSKILITFMELLEKSDVVTLEQLTEACKGIPKFSGNYAQMINLADKNHGKVFSGTSENLTLWEPVKDFIIQQYIEFKKSYYSKF